MTNTGTNPDRKYDLADRTLKFGLNIITLCRSLPQDNITKPLVNQLVRAGTSIGANYAEADAANSKKDFTNKIAIAKKEASETKYWLKLLSQTLPNKKNDIDKLFREAEELNLIFAAIIRKARSNQN